MKKYYIQTKSTDYNEKTGISTAWIVTDLGDFFGKAKLSPEDKDIASNFAGCKYAEMRAILKYSKLKIKILKAQLEPLLRIKNNYEKMNVSKLGYKNKAMEEVEKEIKRLKDNLTIITLKRNNLENKLKNDINTRQEAINYILKKKEQIQGNK